jgi:DNA topoisomerase I
MTRRGGWTRLGRRRFRYVDAHGTEIDDPEQLERIRSLVIPPAWTDVWISPNPGAKLQATGVDAAGRHQYLYHERYRAAREREKFERLLHFATQLPDLRARTRQHLRLGP